MDESTFTNRTVKIRSFSQLGAHCHHPLDKEKLKSVHLVAAVSEENGLESHKIFTSPINSKTFCSILPGVQYFGDNFVIFGDNSSWHTSKKT